MIDAPALHLSGRATIGGTPIFGPLTLEAPAGEWTCLLGPSGVGKSTLLRLLAGLGEEVVFDGDLAAGDGAPLQGRVALMAQSDLLLPWLDATENVALGARLRGEAPQRDRARDVLVRVGLADHAGKRPHALSGGQRQRVALARTLMEDRPVVLLDEPFSALDARARARMQDLSAEVLAGRTVLHVTHDAGEAARLGTRVLVMSRDGLADVPPPDTRPPRPFDAGDTLAYQGKLMRLLMEAV
ncbi:ABC transporter ATP-binding protein [Roseivivax sediminis]|uniref:Putative hydroxymethylpyrimidine transport system ATP-binding protein n=1 Tax=Roseivivax sediminis TaxID=936889 RepID=A0A1I1X5N9_9RHOB|nr:ABC transporter ATP-binding protein [Roseivivax sediminis]SFE02677.1 putative hydroxymethylpyrimidine transport system ATP-binding protein [Roseivivax sediminis]